MVQQINSSQANASLTLSGSPLLTATTPGAGANWMQAYCTEFFSTGKFYWETTVPSGQPTIVGIGNSSSSIVTGNAPGFSESNSAGYDINGNVYYAAGFSYTVPLFTTTLIACAWQVGGGVNRLWFSDVINNPGVFFGASTTAGNPAAGTGGADITINGGITGSSWTPGMAMNVNSSSATFRFAPSSWTGTPPSGFGPFDPAGHNLPLLGVGQFITDAVGVYLPFAAARGLIENKSQTRRQFFIGWQLGRK